MNKEFSFGDFTIDAVRRLLLNNGKPVNLNPKAFDLLLVLVENYGKTLSKDELLGTVWEGQFVEENNLTVHISTLRKIFGERKGENRYIVTIPGRGYTFVAKVHESRSENSAPNFSAAGGETPPLHTAATGDGQNALPAGGAADDALIGRESEITEIKNLLRRESVRLVTLTGVGGTGKTRLAQAVAPAVAADFTDGVYFIELAAISQPELVAPVVAQSLGVSESADKAPVEVLKNFLRERRVLLILDNFEQILSAAPLVEELIAATVYLKILVTSRAALQLKIEREAVVTPLCLPPRDAAFSAAESSGYPAVALFAARARAVKPNFVLSEENARAVAEICHKLDGLPLAIELAAARIRLLTPAAILARLENSLQLLTGGAQDLPARRQTMYDTIQWSYDLLREDEKRFFRRLAVFVGGFTIEAVEAVVGGRWSVVGKNPVENPVLENPPEKIENKPPTTDHRPPTTALDLLTSLIDNSLLTLKEQPDGGIRLRMLEVVREFAGGCLEQSGEAEILRRDHARYFVALAEEAAPHLPGAESVRWLNLLEDEHDNLRAAFRWLLRNEVESAARLAVAIWFFWNLHSHLTEGRAKLKAVLENPRLKVSSDVRFKLLRAAAAFAQAQGDYPAARKNYDDSLVIGRAENDLRKIGLASRGLGIVAYRQGDLTTARALLEEGLSAGRVIGDKSGIAAALNFLGNLARAEDDNEAARLYFEEGLTIARELGNREAISSNLNNLGEIAVTEHNLAKAGAYFSEALTTAEELGSKAPLGCSMDGLAALAAARGETQRAAQLAGAAEILRQSIGFDNEPAERRFREFYLNKIRTALDEKSFAAAYAHGQQLELTEALALAKVFVPEVVFGHDGKTTEIIIENHKLERIFIEERTGVDAPRRETGFHAARAVSPVAGEIPARSASDRRAVLLVGGALIFVLLIAGGFALWHQNSTRQSPEITPKISFTGAKIKQLTTRGAVSWATVSPDGKFYAYALHERGEYKQSLWLGQTDGSNEIQLRPPIGNYHGIVFAPDGKTLYFTVANAEAGQNGLFKMPVLGGVAEKLFDDVRTSFAVSPDGKQIAYTRTNSEKNVSSLIVTNLDNVREKREIAARPAETPFSSRPAFSPDGRLIAIPAINNAANGINEIFVVHTSDGRVEQITALDWVRVFNLAWTRDGKGLIAVATERRETLRHLWQIDYPAGDARRISSDTDSYGSALNISADGISLMAVQLKQEGNIWVAPANELSAARQATFSSMNGIYGWYGFDWAPDNKIVFTAGVDRTHAIHSIDQSSGNVRQITTAGFYDHKPSVTPDGRYIVFQSNRSGNMEIWRVNADGGDLRQLTNGGGSAAPHLTPDGQTVIYLSIRNETVSLRRVSIDGGADIQIIEKTSLADPRVSPDGRFIACGFESGGGKVTAQVAIVALEDGRPVKLFDVPKTANFRQSLRWTPDGKAVCYRDWANGIWRQSLDGGEPEKLKGLPEEKIYNFGWSADGKHFAFARGREISDAVLISGISE